MILAAVTALALGLGPDPCGPVEPAAEDPAVAAEYRAVGDAERRAGSRDTAAAAYRAAVARDPRDDRARAALAELCRDERTGSAFERGVRLMEAGDRAGAAAAFEEARAAGPDSAAALLEGICRYEEGEDERARPLLAEAERDPRHRDAARFFLGLLSLRAGRAAEAAALLEASAADRHLGPIALPLVRDARREGRVVLSVLLEGGWDSNVDQAPDGSRQATVTSDGAIGATGVVRASPLGADGPFLRGAATFRNQLQYGPLDLRGGTAAAGWQAGRGGRYGLLEYAYEYRDVGGGPYLSANRLLAAGRIAPGAGTGVSAGLLYSARWEHYLTSSDAPYSGLRHLAEADVTFDLGRRSTATLAWHVGRDAAGEAALSWREHGPRAGVRLELGRDVRLGLDAAFSWRLYDVVDPAFLVQREDGVLDLAALLEAELADRWTLRLSAAFRRALSNVPDFRYGKLVPVIGLAYTTGLL